LGWKDWGILFIFMIVIFFLEELRKKMFANPNKLRK